MVIETDSSIESNPITISTTLVFATTAIIAVYFIYAKVWATERWEKYGVKQASFSLRELPVHMIERLLDDHGPTVGIMRGRPVLITRDLDLLKQIMIKDFNNFVDREDILPSKCLVAKGLVFLKGDDWKRIRQLLTPSFSTAKLKRASTHVQEAAQSLAASFETCAREGLRIKLLHTTGQYTTSIIAKTAFGVQADCIGKEEDDEFTRRAKNIAKKRNKWSARVILIITRFRWLRDVLLHYFSFNLLDPVPSDTREYFETLLEDALKEREEAELRGQGSQYNDFLQSLVSTKVATDAAGRQENGSPSGSNQKSHTSKKTITREEVIAQSFLTIFAAFETTSSTLHFCLLKLAQNPDIQEKVHAEIFDQIIAHHNMEEGDLNPSYEDLARLPYMEQVIDETLRLFPPFIAVSRAAYNTRTYGELTIPAGAGIIVPIRSIQRDPTHWPDPERFDPDRFSEEAKAGRHPLAFMPFGQGPRLCIGMRLAYLEMKAALVHVLSKVKVELNDATVPRKGEDIQMNFLSFPRPMEPVQLAVKLRKR